MLWLDCKQLVLGKLSVAFVLPTMDETHEINERRYICRFICRENPVSWIRAWYLLIIGLWAGFPLRLLDWRLLGWWRRRLLSFLLVFPLSVAIIAILGVAKAAFIFLFWNGIAAYGVHVPLTVRTLVSCAAFWVGRELAKSSAATNNIRHCQNVFVSIPHDITRYYRVSLLITSKKDRVS